MIKRRSMSVGVVCMIAVPLLWVFSEASDDPEVMMINGLFMYIIILYNIIIIYDLHCFLEKLSLT